MSDGHDECGGSDGRRGEGRAHRGWALFTILCMTFMETLDGTIVNVALPTMQAELCVEATQIQLVASAFLVVTCPFLLVLGRLGDIVGKARVFQLGVVLFTAGSALVGARVVQALGVAASLANNQGIITEMFAESRGRALGLVATFTALGAMAGPTIGGALVSALPWESIFVINLPIGLVSLLVGLRVLPNRRPTERHSFDVVGALLVVPSILLLFVAITLMDSGVSPTALAALAVGAALLVAFVLAERRQEEPLVRLEVFRSASFDIDLVSMVLVFLGLSLLTLSTPVSSIVPMLMFTSLGSAVFQSPNNSLIMGHAAPETLGFVGSLGNLMRYLGQSLGVTVSMGVLYGAMSARAGRVVTSYVPGEPELFMAGLSTVFRVLAALVLVGLALSLVRTLVIDRRHR